MFGAARLALLRRRCGDVECDRCVTVCVACSDGAAVRQGDEWPLESWCELLCDDLMSPQWEVRHGAVTALRETLKIHGTGAGRRPGLTENQVLRASSAGSCRDGTRHVHGSD